MGLIADTLAGLPDRTELEGARGARDTLPDIVGQGLRSGGLGMGSSVLNAVGATADELGLRDPAGAIYSKADELAARAAQAAPRINTFKDARAAGGARDYVDYAAGMFGQALPSVGIGTGAALLTGGAAVPGMLAGAAAMAPAEIGDVVARQRSQGEAVDLGKAALAGGGSAALQGIVPGVVGAKLAGKAGAAPAKGGVTRKVATNLAEGTLGEGALEAGGEVIKQVGAGGDLGNLDTEQILEAGVGGAAGGVAFGGLGAAGDIVQGSKDGIVDAGRRAVGAVGNAAAGFKDKVGGARDAAQGIPVGDLFKDAKTGADDSLDRIMSGKPFGNLAEFATAQGERLNELVRQSDGEKLTKIKEYADNLMNDVGLTPERRDQVVQASQDLSSEANQQIVAGVAKARELGKQAASSVQSLYDSVSKSLGEPKEGDAKRSEVMPSGLRRTITDTLSPILRESSPGVLENPETLTSFGAALRKAIQVAERDGNVPESVQRGLDQHLGAQTAQVLETVRAAMPRKGNDEKFFAALNDLADKQKKQQTTLDVIKENLVGDLKKTVTPAQLRAAESNIRAFLDDSAMSRAGPAEREQRMRQFREQMTAKFGPNADKVIEALGGRQLSEELVNDTEGLTEKDSADEREPAQYYGGGSDKNLPEFILDDETHTQRYGNKSRAAELMERAAKENPDRNVSWMTAKEYAKENGMSDEELRIATRGEPDKYGLVIAEGTKNEARLSSEEFDRMKLDTTKTANLKNPSRIDTGVRGVTLDAMRMTRVMNRKLPYVDSDDISKAHRIGRAFMEALAAAQDRLGVTNATGETFTVPDSTVVAYQSGKPFTYGDVKKLKFSTETADGRIEDDDRTRRIDRELKDIELKIVDSDDPKERRKLVEKWKKLSEQAQAEQIEADQDPLKTGRENPDPQRDVVSSAAIAGEDAIEQRTNLDGLPRKAPSRAAKIDQMRAALTDLAKEMRANTAAPVRAVAERLERLIKAAGRLSTTDFEALTDLVPRDVKNSERAEVINRIADKLNAQRGAIPDPKALAAKKAAFLEKARSGDLELLSQLRSSDDPKGLQRAVESLVGKSGTDETRRVINTRLAELVQQPDVAYGLQTKKYSLMSTQIHEDLKRPGFAATHDSPIKHGGKFDWRSHEGKGEGLAAYGAGTYLSTADNVHKYYKAFFTDAAKETSPTYHVSVDIDPAKLLDWDKPLSELSASVRLRAMKAIQDNKLVGEDQDDNGRVVGSPLSLRDTGETLYKALTNELGSQRAASDYLQSLGIPGLTYAAAAGKNVKAPNFVIFDDSRIATNYVHFDRTKADPQHMSTATLRKTVGDHINDVLAKSVKLEWANLGYAGEFDTSLGQDTIRLSVHSLDPMSTAFHESMHAFVKQMRSKGLHDVANSLFEAADNQDVQRQLRTLLKGEPDALRQLADPEERVAYMYQFWAAGQLKVAPAAKSVLDKIKEFIRRVLGVWSNDERALHIMEYFNRGEYAKDMSDSAVRRAVLDAGRNPAIEKARSFTKPLANLADALASTGSSRLRDSGVPALREVANLVHAEQTSTQDDPGFITAARVARTEMLNRLGANLQRYSKEEITAALESLQTKRADPSVKVRSAAATVRKTLDDVFDYMQDAGVTVRNLGYGRDYFPRVYSADYISRHQTEFVAMLERNGLPNQEAQDVMRKLMITDGNQFGIETNMPGMQFLKSRKLAEISDADLAPFMEKDLLRVMDSYITQAARRAEWAKRFNDDGSRLKMLFSQAKKEGATDQDLGVAEDFIRGVDGTLGDQGGPFDLTPGVRRTMGNVLVYQNIRLLPLAIFSSIVDPVGVVVRGGTVRDAFETLTRGLKETVKSFQKLPSKDADTELAETLGVIENSMLSHTLGQLYSQGMVGDTARKINDTFFRYNLMEQWNRSVRVGATQAALRFIGRHADGTADPHSERWLKELGLAPGQVVFYNGRVATSTSEGLTSDQELAIRTAVNRWVDGAVLRPNAADKPIWFNDPHYVLFSHLKQFVYSFQTTILGRVMHEYEQGNYRPAMALASYVPIMIAADLIKGLAQGGGELPEWKKGWDAGDYVWSGVQRAGLLGVGQFAVDGPGTLAGPTIEQLAGAVQVIGGNKEFEPFALKSMPANAIYAESVRSSGDLIDAPR